jgi:bifunctional oligoribonuclease and PAP phosphatase NrnA
LLPNSFKMSISQIREAGRVKELVATPKKIVITTHHKPDADALGSSLAMYHLLKKLNHDVTVISPSDYPRFLNWMPEQEQVVEFDPRHKAPVQKLISEAELIFCLDFNALSRIYDLEPLVRNSSAIKIIVDHHLEPEKFADVWYWDNKASATCELIFELIVEMGYSQYLDVAIGESLYAGIMTDTGSFRFPCTTAKVHHIIAELIALGVDNSKIHQEIYDNNSEQRLRFLGYSFTERLTVMREFNTAYFVISGDDLIRFNSQTGDTEGLVNYALSLEGIVFAAIIVERPDMVKMSFRSKGDFSARDFASNNFEGGGHKNASGGKSNLSLYETEQKFVKAVASLKNELTSIK